MRNRSARTFSASLIAATFFANVAGAGQALGLASDPDIAISHHDRVYAAEQFSNTLSVTDPVDNTLLGIAADGLITLRSSFGPEETMNRFEAEVRARGMTVFAHIDHAAGAATVGLPLRPTDLLIFGAANAGTPLIQAAQTVGIDLPLKALVWQDEAGATFLSYNDLDYVTHRHGLDEGVGPIAKAISDALKAIAEKATTAP